MPILVRGLARPLCALLAALTLGPLPLAADDRSTELLHYGCSSALSRRDVTLFANGTVRLRQGPLDAQELYLDELLPEELGSYIAQLRAIQAAAVTSAVDLPANAPSGEWVEGCEIRLALPGAKPATYATSAYEIPLLVVTNLIHVAEDLAEFTRPPELAERLPRGYRPRPGDVLRNAEGGRFRVVDLTSDELGVELEELGSPVMILVPLAELGEIFPVLEEPGDR